MKRNAMLDKLEARFEARKRAEMDILMQMGQDAAMIAANEVLQLGPGRAEAFCRAYIAAMNDMARMTFEDQKPFCPLAVRSTAASRRRGRRERTHQDRLYRFGGPGRPGDHPGPQRLHRARGAGEAGQEQLLHLLCGVLERGERRVMEDIRFTIPLPPVTKKNSQRIINCGKYRKIAPSKAYERYERDAGYFIPHRGERQERPCEVACRFYMPTRRRVDLTNLPEAVDDVLVHYGVLADDNSRIIVSHDGSRVLYNKAAPRTEVTIRFLEGEPC